MSSGKPSQEPVLSADASSESSLLRQFLADRDLPCPMCAYNLRGLTSDRCPECGQRLTLHVAPADLRLGPWFVLAGSSLAAAALGAFLLAITFMEGWPYGGRRLLLNVTMGYFLLAMVTPWPVIRGRRRLQRLRTRSQWYLALGAMIAFVLGLG